MRVGREVVELTHVSRYIVHTLGLRVVAILKDEEDQARIIFVGGEVAMLEEVGDTLLSIEIPLAMLRIIEVDQVGISELLSFV